MRPKADAGGQKIVAAFMLSPQSRVIWCGMDAHFSITVDPRRVLMRVTLGGFFEAADLDRFVAARGAAHARLRCAPNQHLTLVDIRQMRIQSRDTVDAFTAVLASPGFHARRIAFVVEKSLARTQVQRAASGRHAQFFTDYRAALDWLVADLQPSKSPV